MFAETETAIASQMLAGLQVPKSNSTGEGIRRGHVMQRWCVVMLQVSLDLISIWFDASAAP